ncbi:MAG: penicillin acylase family protein [Eudoraea sp.]
MKYLKFVVSLLLTALVFYGLNNKFGSIPPIGKFLNPYTGIWQNERETKIDGTIALAGLKEEVTVHYDEHLIPHVFAQNDLDLYRVQGYITAKHRLWQMEFQTYGAAGRISEIIGEVALDYDRHQRRRGNVYGAERALKKMQENPELYSALEAYAAGVNDFVNELDGADLPVEYKLLDYQPEFWTPLKSALFLMYMTKDLAGGDNDLEYTNALRIFGKERFDLLFPDFFDTIDPVIPMETDWSFITTPITPVPQGEIPLDTIAQTLPNPPPGIGSNNWAVSGKKTYSGNAILANDPHLKLNLPSIWYIMQLSTPEYNSFGATLPGALGVISGFNNYISWGETNATRDVMDWYKIEFRDAGMAEYRYDGKWEKSTLRVEEIKIKGQPSYIDSVYYTRHGPVVFDPNFRSESGYSGYAMKWMGHEGGNTQSTFIKLNKSKNYSDYNEALKNHIAPAQNFAFASVDGDIALWIQGKFPNKWKGQGKFLMDGSNPEHEWQGFIPQEFNAHTLNPERGFVSSANQHPVDPSYPYFVFNDFYEAYRNRIINDFFTSKETFDIQDFKNLQNNNYNLKAYELLPFIFETMDSTSLSGDELVIYEKIKKWDFYNDISKIGPSIWTSWWEELYDLTWDEFNKEGVALTKPTSYQTIHLLKTKGDDPFMDIVKTPEKEAAKDLFLISFKNAVRSLSVWEEENGEYNWQTYKGTYVGHLLQGLPAFSHFDLPIGGDGSTVNAATKNHGPSWRMIVEMTSPPTAYGIYPGGQSGNPGSKYYDNFIESWARGNYLNLLFMQAKTNKEGIMATQTLIPQ